MRIAVVGGAGAMGSVTVTDLARSQGVDEVVLIDTDLDRAGELAEGLSGSVTVVDAVEPPTPSLGLMLSEGRNFLLLGPWSAVFAGFAILFLSFGFNLLGDALRDTLDPRLRKLA